MNSTFFKSQFVKAIIPLSLPFIVLSQYIVSNINKTIEYYDMQNITYVEVPDAEYGVLYDTIYVMKPITAKTTFNNIKTSKFQMNTKCHKMRMNSSSHLKNVS